MMHMLILLFLMGFAGCGPSQKVSVSTRDQDSSSTITNSVDHGLIYTANPIVASGNSALTNPVYSSALKTEFITSNDTLMLDQSFTMATSSTTSQTVEGVIPFLEVYETQDPDLVPLTTNTSGTWDYNVGTREFYQVNLFFHTKKIINFFMKAFSVAHANLFFEIPLTKPVATKSNVLDTGSLWLTDNGDIQTINAYSHCEVTPINAYFSPNDATICMGYDESVADSFAIVQDPSVIYHETGHLLVHSMLNQRNIKNDGFTKTTLEFQSSLGKLFYDEAGAINEGIADYFSYLINARDSIGEWGVGRFFAAARPLTESSELHTTSGVSDNVEERISYPFYVQYDANMPTEQIEAVHQSGQIVSHFLVRLSRELGSSCYDQLSLGKSAATFMTEYTELVEDNFAQLYGSSWVSDNSETVVKHAVGTALVLMVLNDTLAGLGDLYGEGSDYIADGQYFENLNESESYLWQHTVNPINFRKFFKRFAENTKHYVIEGLCDEYTLDELEILLDSYGVLLFTQYENNRARDENTTWEDVLSSGPTPVGLSQPESVITSSLNTNVNEENRRLTNLVSKDYIAIDEDTIAYVIDSPTSINSILNNLEFEGKAVQTSTGLAGTVYNNSNAQVSPGEVLGIAVNLRNNSNSTIGGLQLLANNWDHMVLSNSANRKIYRFKDGNYPSVAEWLPCQYDSFPLVSEGGVESVSSSTEGDCDYITRDNRVHDETNTENFTLDAPQPVCLVEFRDEEETIWVSQDRMRHELGLMDSECLNGTSFVNDEEFNPNECLMRFLPGANQSYFSKVDAQKTWGETNFGSGDSPTLSSNQAMLLEVNKEVPKGTRFVCRLRARFTNCSDCFNKDDFSRDFYDYEYAGAEPFKIIHLDFTVTD